MITESGGAFRSIAGGLKSAVIPDRGDGRLALFHEGQAQKRAALHGVAAGEAALARLGHFLELADGFLEEPHFTERDAQVVSLFPAFLLPPHPTPLRAKLLQPLL